MKTRKTVHADLEKKRSVFFELGLITSLAVVIFMMEYNFRTKESVNISFDTEVSAEQEMVPITRQEQSVPPPPPSPVKVYDVLNIVDDDTEIIEDLEILDTETDENQEIEIVDFDNVELEEETEEATVFIIVEEMPVFRPDICKTPQEGNVELLNYISKSIHYPVIAAENNIQGRVYINFVVSRTGDVTNVVVTRGVHPELDKEAIRVVENLPKFSAGKQRGKPVKVQYSVPINFILQ